MATVLPPVRNDISGTAPNPSNAVARTAFGVLHDYLINLLGSAGTPAAARTALGAVAATDIKQLQSVDYTLAGNALTLKLNPTNLDFRSTTLTSGAPINVSTATQLTTTISSGSTGGTVNAVQSDIILLAINNVGAMELAWTNAAGGLVLDEQGVITTVAEGGAGAADSATTIYSTTARTGVAYRVVGLFRSTQTVAGTWAQIPTLVQGIGGRALVTTSRQFMIVEDQKAAGSHGGSSSAGDNIRVLNTVVSNTITGASLAGNQVTLPAGTYRVTASAPVLNSNYTRIRLVNVTDSAVLVLGSNSFAQPAENHGCLALIEGIFTIAATKVLNLTHYIDMAQATNGLGTLTGDSQTAVFAHITFEKV